MINVSEYAKNTIHSDNRSIDMWVSFDNHSELNLFSEDIKADSLTLEESICGSSNFQLGGANVSAVEFEFSKNTAIGTSDIEGYTFRPYLVIPLVDDNGDAIPYKSDVALINNSILIDETVTMPTTTVAGQGGVRLWRGSSIVATYSGLKAGDVVRVREYLFDVKPSESITLNGWTSSQSASWEIDLSNSQQCEMVPLGVFKVDSCSIKSSSELRKLKGYDLLYTTELDSEITYNEGQVVTMADLLDKAYEAIGQEFVAPYTLKNILYTNGTTTEGNEYTFEAPNNAKITVRTKTTKTLVNDVDITAQHEFQYVNVYDQDGDMTYIDNALKYFGAWNNQGNEAWASAFSSDDESDIGYLRKNVQSILRPELNILTDSDNNKYVNIPSLDCIWSEGNVQINTADYKYEIDNHLVDGIDPSAPVYARSTVIGFHTTPNGKTELTLVKDNFTSIGRAKKSYIMKRQLAITTARNTEQYVSIGEFLEDIEDEVLEQFKALNLCSDQGEFYEESDRQSYEQTWLAYYNAVSTYFSEHFETVPGMAGYYAVPFWTLYTYTDVNGNTVTSAAYLADDFPVAIYIPELGAFGELVRNVIDFNTDFDPESGGIWWGPDMPLKGVIERVYEDKIAGLSFVASGEVTFTPREAIQAYAEMNGKFFAMDRYGQPKFVDPRNSSLYPAEDLYPEDSLYPENDISHDYGGASTRVFAMNTSRPFTYKGIRFELAEGWTDATIKDVNGDKVYDVSNIITANFTLTSEWLATVTNNIWYEIEALTMLNADITVSGSPWIECGDIVVVSDGGLSSDVLVVDRKLQGINVITDNFYHKFSK